MTIRATNRVRRVLIVLMGVALLGGASRAQEEPKPAPPKAEEPKMPELDMSNVAAPVDPRTYVIGAEDVLQIRVWREPDLSGNVMVRPDGKITLALVGDVEAAGHTPEQLTRRVTEALSKILNKPEVMVSVMSVQSKRYFVSGNVQRAGPTPLVTPTTVLQALSVAGFREWAKKNKIVIMRGTERLKFNYNDVIKGKKLEQNIYLQDGDHIYVP
jgi:polysaccharide biosynthesis/export protein